MQKSLLIVVILCLSFGCSETHKIDKMAKALANCENKWTYFKLIQPIRGKVLLQTKGYCGYFHSHTNTIVVVGNSDTIRVNGPCYTENAAVSDSVIVSAYENDDVIGAVGDSKYDCIIMKTCYGIITKIK